METFAASKSYAQHSAGKNTGGWLTCGQLHSHPSDGACVG